MARKYRTPIRVLEVLAPRAVEILADHQPRLAVTLAIAMGVSGNHRDCRRTIRDVIKYARHELGEEICANLTVGYWLARNRQEWLDYKEAERRRAVFKFVAIRHMEEAVRDRTSGRCWCFLETRD